MVIAHLVSRDDDALLAWDHHDAARAAYDKQPRW